MFYVNVNDSYKCPLCRFNLVIALIKIYCGDGYINAISVDDDLEEDDDLEDQAIIL